MSTMSELIASGKMKICGEKRIYLARWYIKAKPVHKNKDVCGYRVQLFGNLVFFVDKEEFDKCFVRQKADIYRCNYPIYAAPVEIKEDGAKRKEMHCLYCRDYCTNFETRDFFGWVDDNIPLEHKKLKKHDEILQILPKFIPYEIWDKERRKRGRPKQETSPDKPESGASKKTSKRKQP